MQLFYQPGVLKGINHLDPEESRHCIKVLRKKRFDTINIVDGKGTFYQAQIKETNPKKTSFEIVAKETESTTNSKIHLAVAPTKRLERMEWLVEKATELAVDRISFIECKYSERTRLRLDRLQRKAISAMKQSLKATLPVLDDVIKFKDFFSLIAPETNKLLAHLDESAVSLSNASSDGSSYCVLVGPEGGFSDDEIRRAIADGYQPVTLGRSRLRTETAALTAVAGIQLVNW